MISTDDHSELDHSPVIIQKIEDFIIKIDEIRASGGKVKIEFELPFPLVEEDKQYFNEVLSLAFAELIDDTSLNKK